MKSIVKTSLLEIQKQTVEKVATLITTGFGLVAAIAWNSAIQGWFQSQDWLSKGGPWIYAILVTLFAVAMTLWVGRISGRISAEQELKKNKEQKK